MAGESPRPGVAALHWLAYVTALPTEDPAARMRVLRTLESLGCAVLRDGVFLLPDTPAARQGLTSLNDHIARIGGSAHLLSVNSLDEAQTRHFLGLFDRTRKYEELIKTVESIKSAVGLTDSVSIMRLLAKHKRDFKISAPSISFRRTSKERAARALVEAEQAVHTLIFPQAPKKGGALDTTGKQYFQRMWATRKPLWADQLASAWLIRRFIDPEAKLLWLDKNQECPEKAIGYAYDGATFCNSKRKRHVRGDPLRVQAGAERRAGAHRHAHTCARRGRTQMAEAAGVQTLLQGALRRTESEEQLLAETEMTFDLLYEAYFEAPGRAKAG